MIVVSGHVVTDSELAWHFSRSPGPGGQHVNKTESAIRITHLPSGIVIFVQEERSQHKNRARAMSLLRSKLYDAERTAKDAVRAADLVDLPMTLPVAADIPAGRADGPPLAAGTAHRIMTGAALPAGADAVVQVEWTDAGHGAQRSWTTEPGIDRVLLTGDFNSYEKEDPIDVILAAGYTDLGEATGKKSYAFDGAVGSLDHVFASQAAAADVTGADIWNINSVESFAYQYVGDPALYSPDQYRSSDHDPLVLGLDLDE